LTVLLPAGFCESGEEEEGSSLKGGTCGRGMSDRTRLFLGSREEKGDNEREAPHYLQNEPIVLPHKERHGLWVGTLYRILCTTFPWSGPGPHLEMSKFPPDSNL
jgi:hypothetical protein